MITLYYDPASVSCQKVLLVLEELSIPWKGELISLLEGDQHKESFRLINPQSEVPVIIDDGFLICESEVISEYLASVQPKQHLVPADLKLKASMKSFVYRTCSDLHLSCGYLTYTILARPFFLLQPKDEVLQKIHNTVDPVLRSSRLESFEKGSESPLFKQSILSYVKVLEQSNKRLDNHQWLSGDGFTLSDVTLFAYLLRLDHLGMLNILEPYQNIQAWYQRCTQRPSYKTAIIDRLPNGFVEFGREAGSALNEQIKSIISH